MIRSVVLELILKEYLEFIKEDKNIGPHTYASYIGDYLYRKEEEAIAAANLKNGNFNSLAATYDPDILRK